MQHEHHRVPVTAVCLWQHNIVLAGEGHLLKAYDLESKVLLGAIQVFEGQAVHGIIKSDGTAEPVVLVWGGQFLRQVRLHLHAGHHVNWDFGKLEDAADWILHGAFSQGSGKHFSNAMLVTAHNALILATPCGLTTKLETLVPGSNCILYSAHISWLSHSHCLIASGTAFGDITVWSCTLLTDRDDSSIIGAEQQIHYAFSAHEGSVFGLHIAPANVAAVLGYREYVLASCSDDRTVRIWDISDLSIQTAPWAETQRATGFGSQRNSDEHSPSLLGKVMGHVSRIWHVRFLEAGKNTVGCDVVTFGEDATTILWTMEKASDDAAALPFVFRQRHTDKAHSGKNIWAVSLDCGLHVLTGGADGAISWRSLTSACSSSRSMAVKTNSPCYIKQTDSYRAYGFVGSCEVVATTNAGKVLLLEVGTPGEPAITELSEPIASLRGYSTLASATGFACFAGADGIVYMYSVRSGAILPILETGRKVAGLFVQVHPTHNQAKTTISLLVTNVGASAATLCHLISTPELEQINIRHQTHIDLDKGSVVTSFASFQLLGREFVALGSRNGSIAIYEIPEDAAPKPVGMTETHNRETVASLQLGRSGQSRDLVLYSTGRDGTYAAYMLAIQGNQILIDTIHRLTLSLGPNIEGIGYSPNDALWIWGFRSTQFVVFDVNTQQEVMAVNCGGAHRTWCFQMNEEGGTFVWTKASQMYHETHTALRFQSLNAGGHGREIKATSISPTDGRLIATGAEDTDIKLSVYEGGKFHCVHTLQKHNTGIQHLQWSEKGRFLFSSGGFEEFFVWRISQNVPDLDIGVICVSKHPHSGTSDLRIMSFDVGEATGPNSSDVFLVTMVYSDSTIRLWKFQNQSWLLLASGDYLTSCLTQCIQLNNAPNRIVTTSTDGHLAMWAHHTTSNELSWSSRHQIHQSAILSLEWHKVENGPRIAITGGDDNAVGITRFSTTTCQSLLVPKAHAAAVTAVKVLQSLRDCVWFVSASIDQRVKLWRLDIDQTKEGIDGIEIKLMQNMFTAVADVSTVEKVQVAGGGWGVLICGIGMDVWRTEIHEEEEEE